MIIAVVIAMVIMFLFSQRIANFIHKHPTLKMLALSFLVLVGVSFAIAAPVAGYLMNQWLSGFAFKISLSWWIFAAAGCIALLFALSTIAIQAIRASSVNPTKSLRSE